MRSWRHTITQHSKNTRQQITETWGHGDTPSHNTLKIHGNKSLKHEVMEMHHHTTLRKHMATNEWRMYPGTLDHVLHQVVQQHSDSARHQRNEAWAMGETPLPTTLRKHMATNGIKQSCSTLETMETNDSGMQKGRHWIMCHIKQTCNTLETMATNDWGM